MRLCHRGIEEVRSHRMALRKVAFNPERFSENPE
jgi:hypothetical protein